MSAINFLYSLLGLILFLLIIQKFSKSEKKRQYYKALRRGDELNAIKRGKKYYGSFNQGGKPNNFDLKQIQMDINAIGSGLPIQKKAFRKPLT